MQNCNSRERLKTPSDAQKHGLAHNRCGRSSSRKKHRMPREENRVEVFPWSHLAERLL
jgi:hypothetical protein